MLLITKCEVCKHTSINTCPISEVPATVGVDYIGQNFYDADDVVQYIITKCAWYKDIRDPKSKKAKTF